MAKLQSAGTRKGTRHWDYGDTWDPSIEKKALDPRRIFDPVKEADSFVAAVLPKISNVFETFGEETAGGLGATWNLQDPRVTADIVNRDNRLRGVTDTTWQAVQVAILDGEMAGEGIDKIAKRIGKVFTQAKGYRARMIARTETIGAANAGSYYAAEASEVVGSKIWLAAVDHRTRSSHVSADGQKVALDRKFQVGAATMKYPGDPAGGPSETINCRCTVLYERAVDEIEGEDVEDEIVPVPTPASPDTPDAKPVPATSRTGRTTATTHLPDRVTKPVKKKLDRRLQRYVEVGGEEIGTGTKVHKGVMAGRKRIDEVHAAPTDLPVIPIQQTSGTRTLGSYRYTTRGGEAMDLNVSSAKDTQASVFVHEFGHYFDHQDFGKAKTFSSVEASQGVPDAVLKEWWDAVEQTEAVKTLRSMTGRDATIRKISHVTEDGRVIDLRVDYDFVRYLLNPREMFARSYAQWIATETGDVGLLKEILEDETFGPYPGQWSPEDFAPLAKAFRKVFKTAGLIE